MMDQDQLVEAACQEIVEYTRDRHAVLIFAAGVKHAQHIQRHPSGNPRRRMRVRLRRHAGRRARRTARPVPWRPTSGLFEREPLKYLVNVNVLTTGFDAPRIDCVALLRPTLSPGLFIKRSGAASGSGRESRTASSWTSAAISFVTGRSIRSTSKNQPAATARRAAAPAKECPECRSLIAAGYSVCPDCGYEFPAPDRAKHDSTASTEGVLSGQVTETAYPGAGRLLLRPHQARRRRRRPEDNARRLSHRPLPVQIGVGLFRAHGLRASEGGALVAGIAPTTRSPRRPNRRWISPTLVAWPPPSPITVRSIAGERFDRIVDYQLGEKPEPLPLHQAMGYTDEEIPF